MVYLGGYEQGFAPNTEYGTMSLEELFRLSVAHNGKLTGSSGHQWTAEFRVNHPRSKYFTLDDFAEDVMSTTYIIEKLAATLGQKAGDIQPARVRRLLIQSNSDLHRFILSDHAHVNTVQTPFTEEDFRTFKDLYWTEYAVELANMLIEDETFMSALTKQTQSVQVENGVLADDDALITQLEQLKPTHTNDLGIVESLLADARYDIDLRKILSSYMSGRAEVVVYGVLTTKDVMKQIDEVSRRNGLWDKLDALENESETGKISIPSEFWDVWIAGYLIDNDGPFREIYQNTLLNEGMLNRDHLETLIKTEGNIKKENVEKALIDWCHAFTIMWVKSAALDDCRYDIEQSALKALDDKLKDEIIDFLENTYGFDIQR